MAVWVKAFGCSWRQVNAFSRGVEKMSDLSYSCDSWEGEQPGGWHNPRAFILP